MQETEAAMTRGAFVDPAPARDTTLDDLLCRYAQEVSPLKRGHEVERIRLAFLGRQPMAKVTLADLSAGMVCIVQRSPFIKRHLPRDGFARSHSRRRWRLYGTAVGVGVIARGAVEIASAAFGSLPGGSTIAPAQTAS